MKPKKPNTSKDNKINYLAPKSPGNPNTSQGDLFQIEAEKDINGYGMGVLSNGVPYLNQRGLAKFCGVNAARIGEISSEWTKEQPIPRVEAIKGLVSKAGYVAPGAHIETMHKGVVHFCYPATVCLAILEYYAFDDPNPRPKARDSFRLLAGSKLTDLIYYMVGYNQQKGEQDDEDKKIWDPFLDRLKANYRSVKKGYFSVFNEIDYIYYSMIQNGVIIDEKTVVDISVGQRWATFWDNENLEEIYGKSSNYLHNYPPYYPQSKSNPQPARCYPRKAMGEFHQWLEDDYIGKGKLLNYMKSKDIPPSVLQLVIAAVDPEEPPPDQLLL